MKHLCIDDHDIEAMDNLARKLHQPEKFADNVAVRAEHRWENCGMQIRTTPAWDPAAGCFKMIYRASAECRSDDLRVDATGAPAGGEGFCCYATSTDGINWEKPFVNEYDYPALLWNGKPIGTENNILPSAQDIQLGPIFDPNDRDPERRFKGLAYQGGALAPRVSRGAAVTR